MDYIDGQTLSQWMTDHPKATLDSVRRIVQQVAKGLQALHRKEMLHQDLRPANVMIDAQGTVTLIDLGAVHVAGLSEGTDVAGAQALVGELQYAAPEYFTGDGGSTASDLFSLAVLTYQMLSGALEAHVIVGVEIVQPVHESAGAEQAHGKVEADEAGSPRHEHPLRPQCRLRHFCFTHG